MKDKPENTRKTTIFDAFEFYAVNATIMIYGRFKSGIVPADKRLEKPEEVAAARKRGAIGMNPKPGYYLLRSKRKCSSVVEMDGGDDLKEFYKDSAGYSYYLFRGRDGVKYDLAAAASFDCTLYKHDHYLTDESALPLFPGTVATIETSGDNVKIWTSAPVSPGDLDKVVNDADLFLQEIKPETVDLKPDEICKVSTSLDKKFLSIVREIEIKNDEMFSKIGATIIEEITASKLGDEKSVKEAERVWAAYVTEKKGMLSPEELAIELTKARAAKPYPFNKLLKKGTAGRTERLVNAAKNLDIEGRDWKEVLSEFLRSENWSATPKLYNQNINMIARALVARIPQLGSIAAAEAAINKGIDNVDLDELASDTIDVQKNIEDLGFDFLKNIVFLDAKTDARKYYDARTGTFNQPKTLGVIYATEFSKMTAILGISGKERLTVGTLDNYNLLQVASRMEIAPEHKGELIFKDDDGALVLNNYREQIIPKPAKKFTAEGLAAIDMMVKHFNAVYSPEEMKNIWDWLAFVVQNPGKKVMWWPLLQGTKGVGKSTLGQIIRHHLVGSRYTSEIDTRIIESGNNSYVLDSLFVVMEEVRVSGRYRMQVENALKALITNNEIAVSEKYMVSHTARNRINGILFTNYKDSIKIDEDERRWYPIFSSVRDRFHLVETLGYSKDQAKDYFVKFYRDIADRDSLYGKQVLKWLLERDITDFDHREAPHSVWKEKMIEQEVARHEFAQQVFDTINEGGKGYNEDVVSIRYLYDAVGNRIAEEGGARSNFTITKLNEILQDVLSYRSASAVRVNGAIHRLYTKKYVANREDEERTIALEFYKGMRKHGEVPREALEMFPEEFNPYERVASDMAPDIPDGKLINMDNDDVIPF